MLFQVAPQDVAAVMAAARSKGGEVAEIGEITGGKEAVFFYGEKEIARIPHQPPAELTK
jgi:phosphoribosylformylglycinamidine (FGAM) synthase-like enzyme